MVVKEDSGSNYAFGYVRVSSVGQGSGDGPKRQLKSIQDYCSSNGIKLKNVYQDIGVSGTVEFQERPAFSDMLHQLATNGTKLVVCSNIDRLSRDLLIQELIIRECLSLGIRVISVANGDLTDTEDHSRIMVRQILGSMAQYEKNKLVRRLKLARDRIKAETGKCGGRKKLSETQPDLLKTLLRLHRKPKKGYRKTYRQIADELNVMGFTTAKGNSITVAYVGNVLSRHKRKAYKV